MSIGELWQKFSYSKGCLHNMALQIWAKSVLDSYQTLNPFWESSPTNRKTGMCEGVLASYLFAILMLHSIATVFMDILQATLQ